MTTTSVLIIVILVVLVVILALVGWRMGRRRSLQKRFGPEYDRVVAQQDNRTAAERELRERERRHAELELTPLSAAARTQYAAAWEEVQIRFVDSPTEAVGTADELVTRLIAERGYPTDDYDERLTHLSVEHAATLGHYRDAHEISVRNERGEASTEDLRQALVHYRVLFADLLGEDPIRTPATHHEADPNADRPNADRPNADRPNADRPNADRAEADAPGPARPRPDATTNR